jgi:adenylate cyclase
MSKQHDNQLDAGLESLDANWQQTRSLVGGLFRRNGQAVPMPPPLEQAMHQTGRAIRSVEKTARGNQYHLALLEEMVRATATMTCTLDLQNVLTGVMDTVIEVTGAERAYLMLYDAAEDVFMVSIARNWDQENINEDETLYSRSVIEAAFHEGRPILTTNAQIDNRFKSAASIMQQDLRTILCIPLLLQGEIVGVIYADSRMEHTSFQADWVGLLEAFGAQAAIAIRNAEAYEQVQANLREAEERVQELEIAIDQGKVAEKISEITETDYFARLQAMKDELVNRRKNQT